MQGEEKDGAGRARTSASCDEGRLDDTSRNCDVPLQRRAELIQLACAALNGLVVMHTSEGVPAAETAVMARDYARLTQRAIDEQEVRDYFALLMQIQNPWVNEGAIAKPPEKEVALHRMDRCA